jgi:hypothetical protein
MVGLTKDGPLTLLRNLRAFRVFRLFKRIKSLNKILQALARAVPGVVNAFAVLLLVMSVYAILGVEIFGTVRATRYPSLALPRRSSTGPTMRCAARQRVAHIVSSHAPYGLDWSRAELRSWATRRATRSRSSIRRALRRCRTRRRADNHTARNILAISPPRSSLSSRR